jgi:hypothetical protein
MDAALKSDSACKRENGLASSKKMNLKAALTGNSVGV